jgi:3-dehydroquinate synthase
MLDASVGIKVSVNYLLKNGIGAFHSPRHTFIDPLFLRTNNERQLKAAVGEMMKAGLIYDRRIFELLQKAGSTLIQEKFLAQSQGSSNRAKDAIFMTIQAMIECIGSDLYEENLSREMDFGHTFSRWLERYEDFQLMHGEAVSIDCVYSTLIAEQKGWISQQETDEVLQTYKDMGLYIHVNGLHVGVYQEAIDQIRVHRAGNLRAPLPCPIGHCRWASEITPAELTGAWHRLQAFLRHYPEGILDPNALHQSSTTPATYLSKDGTAVKAMDGFANPTQVVRWGILGCGKIAGDFAQVLTATPNAEITAVAARDRTRAQEFARRHGVHQVCENYQ